MKNYDRYSEPTADDLRETKFFKALCEAVWREIKRLRKNAKYSTLTGKGAKFYTVSYEFNLAIEKLLADKRITERELNRATYFDAVEVKAEDKPKQTKTEYHEQSCAAIFNRQPKAVFPCPSSFPAKTQ